MDAGSNLVELVLERSSSTHGTLLDDARHPIPYATLVVTIRDNGQEREFARGQTDERGRFDLPVPAHRDAAIAFHGTVSTNNGPHHVPLVARLDPAPAGARNIPLRAHAVSQDRAMTVRVNAPDATPVPNARVTLRTPDGTRVASAQTDDQGHADLASLPATQLVITTTATGDWLPATPTSVTPSGRTVTVHLRAARVVRGRVLLDGAPATFPCMVVARADGKVVASHATGTGGPVGTDAGAHFALVIDPDGPTPTRIEARGFGPGPTHYAATLELTPGTAGDPDDVELHLSPD